MLINNIDEFVDGLSQSAPKQWQLFDNYISSEEFSDQLTVTIKQKLQESPKIISGNLLDAKIHFHGIGVERDVSKAIQLLIYLTSTNNPLAQLYLGKCYLDGQGVAKDPGKAFSYFKLAANQHNYSAIFELAKCYYYGLGVEPNREKVYELFSSIAQSEDPDILFELARQYAIGDMVERDDKTAVELYHRAAIKGHVDARYFYARALEKGNGIEKSIPDAIYFYKLAAVDNHSNALYRLGSYYLTDKKTHHSLDLALGYLTNAKEHGSIKAIFKLATYYENIANDPDIAADLYFESYLNSRSIEALAKLNELAENENVSSNAYLFIIYFLGIHAERDESKYNAYYEKNTDILSYVRFIVVNMKDNLSNHLDHLDDLAEFFLTKSAFNKVLEHSSQAEQKVIFSGLLKRYKSRIDSGYPGFKKDVDQLNKMIELGIVGAAETMNDCANFQAERLSLLIEHHNGNFERNLTILHYLENHGVSIAKVALNKYYLNLSKVLMERSSYDQNALSELSALAETRPEAKTVLGTHYLKLAQKKEQKTQYNILGIFKSGRNVSKYKKRALVYYSGAAAQEYDVAFSKLATFFGTDEPSPKNNLLALYYLYHSLRSRNDDKQLNKLKRYTKETNPKIAIAALIYLGVLSSDDNSFHNNKYIRHASKKSASEFAQRILTLINRLNISSVQKLALVNYTLSLKLDGTEQKEKLINLMRSYIFDAVKTSIESENTLSLEWLKYANTKILISCALEIASDHEQYPFFTRALILLAAKEKATIKGVDTSTIDRYLESYLDTDSVSDLDWIKSQIEKVLDSQSSVQVTRQPS